MPLRRDHWPRKYGQMQTIGAILLVGFFGGILWMMLRPPMHFRIRYSRGKVSFTGKFPRSHQAEVEEFLKREFADRGRITIAALRTGPAGLRIVVRGRVTDGDRQRIRNFFQTIC
jgi:hypothetical protein